MRIRYLEWWNTRCEVSGFMFIHLFLQSLYKDMPLYFFFPFFVLSATCTEWMQRRWDFYSESHYLGFLGCKQMCLETLWQCWACSVCHITASVTPVLSPQPAGKGRKGQGDGVCWSYYWNRLGYEQICQRLFLQRGDVLATSAGRACKRARSGFVSPARGNEGLLGLLVLEDFWNVGEQGLLFLLGLSRINYQCFEIKWQCLHKTENFFLFFFSPSAITCYHKETI